MYVIIKGGSRQTWFIKVTSELCDKYALGENRSKGAQLKLFAAIGLPPFLRSISGARVVQCSSLKLTVSVCPSLSLNYLVAVSLVSFCLYVHIFFKSHIFNGFYIVFPTGIIKRFRARNKFVTHFTNILFNIGSC